MKSYIRDFITKLTMNQNFSFSIFRIQTNNKFNNIIHVILLSTDLHLYNIIYLYDQLISVHTCVYRVKNLHRHSAMNVMK